MKFYIVVSNIAGEIGRYEVIPEKLISGELIRVIQETQMILEEGDTITFVSE